jgi:hypothetical protein
MGLLFLFLSRHYLPLLALFLTFFYSSFVFASADTGVTWLKSKQGADGEFYSPQKRNPIPQFSALESFSALIFLINKLALICCLPTHLLPRRRLTTVRNNI